MKPTMQTYIHNSTDVLRANLSRGVELTKAFVEAYRQAPEGEILLIASGSSYNSCVCARRWMEKVLQQRVWIVTPFTFVHYESSLAGVGLCAVVSQSGCSTNAIEALRLIRSLGRPAIGITGNPNSDFETEADQVIDWGVGEEKVGYVTQGVVSLILYLWMAALQIAKETGRLSKEQAETYASELQSAVEIHGEAVIRSEAWVENNYALVTSMHQAYVIGAGASYGTALEGALKIGETIGIPTSAYESEEYLHGPNLQLAPDYTVFIIDPKDETSPRMEAIAEATRQVTERTVLLSLDCDDPHPTTFSLGRQLDEALTPFVFLPLFQMIAWRGAEDLHRWDKHPLFAKFKEKIAYKTESYYQHSQQESQHDSEIEIIS